MSSLSYLSVCSGIEAASVAWHPLGWKPVGFSEIEPFASAVLAHHYPDVCNFGDMTDIADWIGCGLVEAPDILCGGTPCQAFSVAGLRQSLDDARGNLSLVFCEIANAIDTRRTRESKPPAVIFWENVPGVLNTHDNAFGCFLAGLAGEAEPLIPPGKKWENAGLAYGPERTVAWRILDAQYFGLAQRRRRVFVVASARKGLDPATVLFEWEGVRRDTAPSREEGESTACTVTSGASNGSAAHGARSGSAREGLIVPVLCMAHGQGGAEIASERSPTLTCNHEAPIAAIPFDTTQITSPSNYSNPREGDSCHPLAASAHAPVIALNARQDPDSWIERTGPLDTDGGTQAIAVSCKDYGGDAGLVSPTLRSMGHAESHANAGGQVAVCITGDITHTLKAEGFDASEDGTGRGQPIVASPQMSVRRLTPRECERLQGFPDDYTMIPWRTYQEAHRKGVSYEAILALRGMTLSGPSIEDCPDGPRYKAIGNSWAVPVVRWIGERIDAQLTAPEEFK